MTSVPYYQVEDLIRRNCPFTYGDSLRGVVDGEFYKVYEYRTLVYFLRVTGLYPVGFTRSVESGILGRKGRN